MRPRLPGRPSRPQSPLLPLVAALTWHSPGTLVSMQMCVPQGTVSCKRAQPHHLASCVICCTSHATRQHASGTVQGKAGRQGAAPRTHPQHLPRVTDSLEEQEDQDEQIDYDHAVDDAPHGGVRPRHTRRGPLQERIPCTPGELSRSCRVRGWRRTPHRLCATGRHLQTAPAAREDVRPTCLAS